MRSMPETIANPRTIGQLEQRAKFTVIVKFLKPLRVFLRVGFKSKTANMSAFNAATSYLFKNALTGTYPQYEIDYSKAMVSQGTLPGALNPKVRITTTSEIEFTWDDNYDVRNAMAADKVMLVAYNPEKQEAVTIMRGLPGQVGASPLRCLPPLLEMKYNATLLFRAIGRRKYRTVCMWEGLLWKSEDGKMRR